MSREASHRAGSRPRRCGSPRLTRLLLLLAFLACGPAAGTPPTTDAMVCDELTVFVREGCPHCADAETFLAELGGRYPRLTIRVREVTKDPGARDALATVAAERRMRSVSVPLFVLCDEVLVGFASPATTGALLERLLTGEVSAAADELAVPVPAFGALRPGELGLPLFTVALGLLDGFNPCAMWVLLFLLSLLVHVRSRARIALVAGTFVVVSGLVYFAFMAAWLNVFLLLGFSRALQLTLGVLAVLVGLVHLKDFFALHRGLTLSIPESVKPTLYQRARRIVRAENLPIALAGVIVLALLVNLVELLCTAGLPALYTQVLTYYDLPTATYYGYLALYNLAYVFDDAIMVTIAVVTLGQRRLQEHEGRWLKAISGALILVIGLLMLLAPDALVF